MMMGPPAKPRLMGKFNPTLMGMLPSSKPSTMPKKMVTMLGSSSERTSLPSSRTTCSMLSACPTTVTRSPMRNMRSGVASRRRSSRLMRLTVTP